MAEIITRSRVMIGDQDDAQLTGSKSTGRDVAHLLRDVFQAHIEAVTLVESKAQELEKKCNKHEQRNAQLMRKGRDLQIRFDDLTVESDKVTKDLVESKAQLSMSCKSCEVLRGQLEQQEKLYQLVVNSLNKDQLGRATDQHQSSPYKQRMSSNKQTSSPVDRDTSQTCASMSSNETNVVKSTPDMHHRTTIQADSDCHDDDDSHSQSQTLLHSNHARRKVMEQTPMHRTKQLEQNFHETDQSEIALQKENCPGEETSPCLGKGRSLKLARNIKRARTKYTEETMLPENKKHKCSLEKSDTSDSSILENQGEFVLQPIETQYPDHHDNTINILAPETCDPDMTLDTRHSTHKKKKCVNFDVSDDKALSGTASKRREKAAERPNIIIPETMAFDFYDMDEQYSSGDDYQVAAAEDKSVDKNDIQSAVIHVALSPPSHTSTPATSGQCKIQPHLGESPSKLPDQLSSALRKRTSATSPPGHMISRRDSTLSEPSSPVFGRSKDLLQKEEILAKSTNSPSLFDDDDNGEESREGKSVRDSPLSKRLLFKDLTDAQDVIVVSRTVDDDMCDAGDGSPSVLSGRKLTRAVTIPGAVSSPFRSIDRTDINSRSRDDDAFHRKPKRNVKSSPQHKHIVLDSSSPRKKLIQTTLKLGRRNDRSLDPDETRDFGGSGDHLSPFAKTTKQIRPSKAASGKSDDEVLALVLEESRKQFQKDEASRDSASNSYDLTFNEPQFTSTQKGRNVLKAEFYPEKDTSPKFKKPVAPPKWKKIRQGVESEMDVDFDLTRDMGAECPVKQKCTEVSGSMFPVGNDMNGTIDPNVHLSQYDTPFSTPRGSKPESELVPFVDGPGEPYMEPVSVYSLESGNSELDSAQHARATRSSRYQGQTQGTQTNMRRSDRSLRKHGGRSGNNSQNSEDLPDASAKSVVFGGRKAVPSVKSSRVTKSSSRSDVQSKAKCDDDDDDDDSCIEFTTCPDGDDEPELAAYHEDSFDRVPKKPSGPDYAYVDVVRKRDERQKLQSFTCQQCEEYFEGMGLDEDEKRERMKHCRHKARYIRPSTPEHYWSINFPDTQEAEARGYLNTTQAKPSKFRRRRGLRPLFLEDQKDDDDDEQK